jgi:hypothetical protein
MFGDGIAKIINQESRKGQDRTGNKTRQLLVYLID